MQACGLNNVALQQWRWCWRLRFPKLHSQILHSCLFDQGSFALMQEVMAWTTQLVLALMHLHTQPHPILHRDVKQANVLQVLRL